MNNINLFRQEVIKNKSNNYGSVFINTPIQYVVFSIGSTICIVLVILFLIFGEYSEKFIAPGYLNSTKGIARIYPNKNGVIVESNVQQGMTIKKGDNLFIIDTSYDGLGKNSHHRIFAQLQKNKQIIEREISYKTKQLVGLKQLLEKKFISLTTYNRKREEIITLKNNNNLIDMDIIKYQQDSSYIIRAPIDGTISAVNYKKGQYVNLSKPIVKILPDNDVLVAEIFIPAKQSGFLTKHNKIMIRYDAYPYERFGTYKAVIHNISQSIMVDEEEDKPIQIGQPYYKVTAILDSQFVKLYGKEKKVQQGMTISAVIVGSKRKIWQWILDPLCSFYGNLVV